MSMKNWRVYYEDGSMFDNTMGSPEDAPSYGIICIVQADETVGRLIMHLWDWYFYRDDYAQWWGSDVWGLHDQLLSNKPLRAVKLGRNADSRVYQEILSAAMDDEDFPVKSGNRRGVERPHVNM